MIFLQIIEIAKPSLIARVFLDSNAERQGFEPWQHLRVDRLAICSITTLAPLQIRKQK